MPYKDVAKQREYQRLRNQQRREAFFNGRACEWCGSPNDLQLDHIDPESKTSHRIWSWSLKRMQDELAKCRVLCKLCHQVRTGAQQAGWKHGSTTGYHRGCRCNPCRDIFNSWKRTYRAAGGAH